MPNYNFTTLNDPLQTGGTQANGINDAGQIVGVYSDQNGLHGFLLSGGIYTAIDDPLATNFTQAAGINAGGQIVGSYQDSSGNYHGFLRDLSLTLAKSSMS